MFGVEENERFIKNSLGVRLFIGDMEYDQMKFIF